MPSSRSTGGYERSIESIGGRTMTGRSCSVNQLQAGAAPLANVKQPFVKRLFDGREPVDRGRPVQPREVDPGTGQGRRDLPVAVDAMLGEPVGE